MEGTLALHEGGGVGSLSKPISFPSIPQWFGLDLRDHLSVWDCSVAVLRYLSITCQLSFPDCMTSLSSSSGLDAECAHVSRFESRQVVTDLTFTNVSDDSLAKSLGLKADRVQMISLLQKFQRTHRYCLTYSFLNTTNTILWFYLSSNISIGMRLDVLSGIASFGRCGCNIAQGNVFCVDAKLDVARTSVLGIAAYFLIVLISCSQHTVII